MTADSTPIAPQFKQLFTPLQIGSFTVRNRILSTAHYTSMGKDGLPSERHLNYWASKAKGGIGLIVTEVQPVTPSGDAYDNLIATYRDEVVEAFRPITDAVHEHGGRIVAQIWHPPYGQVQEEGAPHWAPSAQSAEEALGSAFPAREVTVKEIEEVVTGFGAAAKRMQEAGLDGVELHGAHGYLIEQFLSPLSNHRTDGYGGTEENRVRFVLEVIDSVRDAVGPDYTVGIRISGDQFRTGGLALDDMKRIVKTITAEGKLDYINVSYSGGPIIASMYVPAGQFVYLAAGIKEVTDLPVFCVGRITDPVLAESILEQNQADIVGMTRANIADPELPNKAREGRLGEIRPCIGIGDGCWGHATAATESGRQEPITCAINPSVGREKETEIRPAEVKKRVMIVGGGIAGLEAARVAAERGHHVTLYEKDETVGGQLQIAAKAPGRQDMAEPVRWYERQLERLGVEVCVGVAVDAEAVRRFAPEALVIATGGIPAEGTFPGADGPNTVQARDVLMECAEVGDRVVVYAGDQGMEGLTTADFLVNRGKDVTLIVPQLSPGARVDGSTRVAILGRLASAGVSVRSETRLRAFEDGSVTVGTLYGGSGELIEDVDTVVLALGSRANNDLFKALRDELGEIHLIGESFSPRKLEHSALDGLRAGLAI